MKEITYFLIITILGFLYFLLIKDYEIAYRYDEIIDFPRLSLSLVINKMFNFTNVYLVLFVSSLFFTFYLRMLLLIKKFNGFLLKLFVLLKITLISIFYNFPIYSGVSYINSDLQPIPHLLLSDLIALISGIYCTNNIYFFIYALLIYFLCRRLIQNLKSIFNKVSSRFFPW